MLASLFVLGAINKIVNYGATLSYMAGADVRPAVLLLPPVIALELVAGLLIIRGGRLAVWAALILVPYTLTTNVFFHDFWTMEEPVRALQLSLFFKNISIAGGLLVVAATIGHRDQKEARARHLGEK